MSSVSVPFLPDQGGVLVALEPDDIELLSQIPEFLNGVGSAGRDPAADRLRVPVYLDDPEASGEWWRLMGSELDQSRAADRSAFELIVAAAGKGTVMSIPEAEAFLRVLNEARLALGARLGVEVAADYETLDEPERGALDYLAWMQGLLVSVLSTG
ncbi:MAG TPA: DUF2017 family protein [Acidimicrobiia bacterium]|nr:DUF2017 family protein [Acidimicrobiia bacterium]